VESRDNTNVIQIGRASCRESGVDLGGRRIIKKKKKKHIDQCRISNTPTPL